MPRSASLALLLLLVAAGPWRDSRPAPAGASFDESVASPLVLAVARRLSLRCLYLLHDGDSDYSGLGEAVAASRLQRRLSWSGLPTTLLSFTQFLEQRTTMRCDSRPFYFLTSNDDANHRLIKELAESTTWGLQGPLTDAVERLQVQEAGGQPNPVWLLFVNATVSSFFADVPLPFDAEILAARQYQSLTEITEVWRVTPELQLQDGRWGLFLRGSLRSPKQALYDRRNSLRGAVIRVVTQHYPPFSIVKYNSHKQQEEASGFMGGVWKALQDKLNFTTRWDVVPENESKRGTFEALSEGRADVALMDYTLTRERINLADFSIPVLFSSYRVFIAKGGVRFVNWGSYLEPFRKELWAVEALTVFTLSATLAAFYYVGRRVFGPGELEEDGAYTFYNAVFYVFGAFCMQGHDVTPKSCALRVVYLVAYLTSIILMAAYSAALISFLAVQVTVLPFEDVQGLVNDGRYEFASTRNSSAHQIMKETTDPLLLQLIMMKSKVRSSDPKLVLAALESAVPSWPSTYFDGLQEVCKRRVVMLAPDEYALTFASKLPCFLVPLPGFRMRMGMAFAFAKRNPYRKVINFNLDRLRNSGALSKLLLDARPPGSSFPSESGDDAAEGGGLTDVDMGDVAPLLAALAVGAATASAFLAAERCCFARRRGRDKGEGFVRGQGFVQGEGFVPGQGRRTLASGPQPQAFALLFARSDKNRFFV